MIPFILLYFAVGLCQEPPELTYVLNFDSAIYVCPDDASLSQVDTSGVEVVNHNETLSTLRGTIEFYKGLDHNTMVEIVVEREVSGRFEVILTHEICDLCEELHGSSPYSKNLKSFGFPDRCPFEPGKYTVNDFVPDNDDLPLNSASAARYQVTINFYNNPDGTCKNEKIFLFCLKLDFIIEPI